MATWTPPADAVETTEGWTPPDDAVEVTPSRTVEPVQRTAPVVQPPKPGYKPTVFEEATGAVTEPIMKMGSGLIAKPISEVAGIAAMFSDYLGGNKDGDPMGFKRHVQESLTYQPRTAAGRSEYNPLNAIPEVVGKGVSTVTTPVMKALRGDSAADSARGMAANFVGEAVPQALGMVGVKNAPLITKQIAKAGPVVGEVAADVMKNASFTKQAAAQAASSADWQRAAAIDAAKKAKEHGILLDTSVSNPTLANRTTGTIAGGSIKVGESMAKANANRWGDAYKKSVGLDTKQPLNLATYEALRTKMAAPYREVAKMGDMVADEGIVKSLNSISVPDVIAKEAAAPKMAHIVDAAVAKAERGMNGAQILEEIKTLRKTGNSLKSKSADPISLAEGKAYLEVAKVFEDMLDNNLVNNPKLLGQVRKARTDIAQSYVAQNATNLTTYRLDPTVLAKQIADGEKLTGTLADLGNIAGNFPHIAKVDPTVWDTAKMHLSRAGVGGSLGFAAGSMVGAPFVGAVIGGGVSELAGKIMNKKMRNAGYQAKNAVPLDRRIPLDGMLTGEPK